MAGLDDSKLQTPAQHPIPYCSNACGAKGNNTIKLNVLQGSRRFHIEFVLNAPAMSFESECAGTLLIGPPNTPIKQGT